MPTKIRWTQETWNPSTGCSHVSPGCERCYAEALSLRFGWSRKAWKAQHARENVVLHRDRLLKPLSWRTPRRVFVNSMSDLFHELIPFDFVDEVFEVMESAPMHTFQVLTKRPERMADYVRERNAKTNSSPSGNIWLGTSVEDQRRARERVPVLLSTPAAVRFLSCEPLLGPLDLSPWLRPHDGIHWVIVGGESGRGFRSMDTDWARTLRDQCVAAGVAYFYKQSSGFRTEMNPYLDGVRWEQYPGDLAPPQPAPSTGAERRRSARRPSAGT